MKGSVWAKFWSMQLAHIKSGPDIFWYKRYLWILTIYYYTTKSVQFTTQTKNLLTASTANPQWSLKALVVSFYLLQLRHCTQSSADDLVPMCELEKNQDPLQETWPVQEQPQTKVLLQRTDANLGRCRPVKSHIWSVRFRQTLSSCSLAEGCFFQQIHWALSTCATGKNQCCFSSFFWPKLCFGPK